MNLVNLTPHEINLIMDNGEVLTIEPSGTVARVTATTVICGRIGAIPITTTEFGEVENLPSPEAGTYYIVSSIVAQSCKDREDVFVPNESVRDENGRIIGCKSLGRI